MTDVDSASPTPLPTRVEFSITRGDVWNARRALAVDERFDRKTARRVSTAWVALIFLPILACDLLDWAAGTPMRTTSVTRATVGMCSTLGIAACVASVVIGLPALFGLKPKHRYRRIALPDSKQSRIAISLWVILLLVLFYGYANLFTWLGHPIGSWFFSLTPQTPPSDLRSRAGGLIGGTIGILIGIWIKANKSAKLGIGERTVLEFEQTGMLVHRGQNVERVEYADVVHIVETDSLFSLAKTKLNLLIVAPKSSISAEAVGFFRNLPAQQGVAQSGQGFPVIIRQD